MMDMNYKGTVIHIGAAPAEEQIYCYSTSDEAQEKACIGHLRGDFGADDEGFFTSWFPHTGKIMADDAYKVFCTELDHVVSALRENGLLKDRATMAKHTARWQEARIPLPYGTYLVVETTVPKDLYQAEPYLVVVDRNSPMSAMATPKGSVLTASDSYQKFTVLDEKIEVYLRITKLDEETGKPVLLPGTAFQIYYLDDDGNYRMENGAPKLVRMTDTVNGNLPKNVTTFYTNAEGVLTLPEKLPLGKYRIVETTAPNGFYNEWLDAKSHYVDFTITTDRIYQATGDKNENGMDTLVIGEKYSNHETLGKLTIICKGVWIIPAIPIKPKSLPRAI